MAVLKNVVLAFVLLVHAGLLYRSAFWNSPVADEPGHLVAGISYWQFGRFDLYRVNPPLTRLAAALPVVSAEPELNWERDTPAPSYRAEFAVGSDFIRANGERFLWLVTLARWACLPFSLLGGVICYLWARKLFGDWAGLLALALWCFCPNVLGHGALITPDMGAAALVVAAAYVFWRWLRQPEWAQVFLAGVVLGLALLAKHTNILLVGIFPVLWLTGNCRKLLRFRQFRPAILGEAGQLAALLLLALLVLNFGYGFEDSFQRLGKYTFISELFGGEEAKGEFGVKGANRFAGSWLGAVPVPVPRNYLQGMDVQRHDFEAKRLSYLRGEFRREGWWYYYLYALAVKVPVGTLLLAALAVFVTLWFGVSAGWRNEVALLLPLLGFLILVSSQTGMNHHMRYALPVLPFAFIWISRVASPEMLKHKVLVVVVVAALLWSITSSMLVYPHSLSYFNELAGGPLNGPKHLLDSNIDWGQDLIFLKKWADNHPEAAPLHVSYFGLYDPWDVYPEMKPFADGQPQPGWFAVSVNHLYGHSVGGRELETRFLWMRQLEPVGYAGYSIYIYHITLEDANRARQKLGLPPLE